MKAIAESANDFRDLRTKKHPCVYVDKTAESALEQIRQRDYLAAHLADGRPVYVLGLAFDSKTRQLKDLLAVMLPDTATDKPHPCCGDAEETEYGIIANMGMLFNIAGPCNPADHYMLPAIGRRGRCRR